jgi:hypothetical protein
MTALFALRVGVCNLTHAKKWGLELDLSARAFRFRHLSRGNLSHIQGKVPIYLGMFMVATHRNKNQKNA